VGASRALQIPDAALVAASGLDGAWSVAIVKKRRDAVQEVAPAHDTGARLGTGSSRYAGGSGDLGSRGRKMQGEAGCGWSRSRPLSGSRN